MGAYSIRTRSKFWPKHRLDWAIFLITLFLMPTIYVYEMFTVYPVVWDFCPNFSNVIPYLGCFIFSNIVGNFVGLVVTDTQVPYEVMSSTKLSAKWHFCDMCVSYVPPRSWHCKTCKTCILKRDHHCLFAGCCVGHYNARFFIMFLVYLLIGTLYCVVSDSMFLVQNVDLATPLALLKVGFPAFAYLSGLETLANECYILIFIINLAALAFVTFMLAYHVRINLKGQVTHDVAESNLKYDLGKLQNVKLVLGNRWYVAWAFPLISSLLPHNGLEWETREDWNSKLHRNSLKGK